MKKLRILLADDHAVVRAGLKLLVNQQLDMEVVGEAGDGLDACQQAKTLCPDVVVMDISMPEMNGVQAAERMRHICPQAKVVILSAFADEVHIRQLLSLGAAGYVLKSTIAEELTRAIRAVVSAGMYLDPAIAGKVVGGYVNPAFRTKGEASLTAREQEVLLDVARGYSNKEIAERLHLSVKTVEGHKARILEKLNLKSRADIVRYALRQGWLQEE
ncbi:MAG: response regulator transcription factor [Abitibacteriaceae bacterium]|nr:response regulator transcription factor [Abditibacteriaceae bacterium]